MTLCYLLTPHDPHAQKLENDSFGTGLWAHFIRGGVEYRADSLEQRGFVDGRTTAHNAAISPLLLAPLSKLALRISEL